MRQVNKGQALNKVFALAEYTDLQGSELSLKQSVALDMLDLFSGVQVTPLGINPDTGEPFPLVPNPDVPGEFLPIGTDPETLELVPERSIHFRPWIVAAKLLLTDQSAQVLSKAEEGVTFTNMRNPIMALLQMQAAYDERWELKIGSEAQTATVRQFAADLFGIDLEPIAVMSAMSAGMTSFRGGAFY
jgi:hypothetical protein